MIDFTNATAVMIGGKSVKKIMHGETLIWEAPSAGYEEIVLFPETDMVTTLSGGNTYANDQVTLNEPLASGDVIIVYVNGKTEEFSIGQLSSSGFFSLSGELVALVSTDTTYKIFFVQFIGDTGNPTRLKITKKVSA